ncbi:MAG: TonB-dependent receptor [Cytophagia bacterium]|nr:TonB-dependent receptor [Cytophagia bacterium]
MLNILKVAALSIVLTTSAYAQSFRGLVRDAKTKQVLIGATVQLQDSKRYFVTNEQGYFWIDKLPEGQHTLIVKFLGYENLTKVVDYKNGNTEVFELTESFVLTDEVIIRSTRADENSPTTFTNIDKATLEKQNFGQDMPFVLNWTPSLVTTSDAGAGVGYTGVRIRGSDATRINVTINGIPYNDSESQGTFWVNLPDIASSTQSVQIQRGVGTSTNGGSAFGASINLETNGKQEKAHAELVNSFGSFGTRRHTLGFGTGLLKNKFSFDGRLSQIVSDGFIDRASSDLKSYYFSGAYYADKTIVRVLAFGGNERTYQSWYGVPESRLNNDVAAMQATASIEGWNTAQLENLLNSNSRTFNPYTYENQVDDYAQYHYQLHLSQQLSEALTGNISLHYTRGKGFYEEFRYDDDFADYGLSPAIVNGNLVESSDIIRRRWLDNHFYGTTYSLSYDVDRLSVVWGGAWNRYVGDHYGEILSSAVPNVPPGYRYYFNVGDKHDFNSFIKTNYQLTEKINAYIDLQYRGVSYKASGKENDQFDFVVNEDFNFFNPKAGLQISLREREQVYASFAVSNREPVRNDFVDNIGATPKHENLQNLEAGYRYANDKLAFNANYYYMYYRDQLVLTGAVNDVGSSIRTNVDRSYRTGIELEMAYQLSNALRWNANVTFSQNKILEFNEVLYDYGLDYSEYNEVINTYKDTDISFSPNVIAGSVFSYSPIANAEVSLLSKYVGKQYLDNTSNEQRRIDAFFVNDIRLTYNWKPDFVKEIGFSLLVNNILNETYESNGFTYGYFGGGETIRQNFYYPQAGTHFLALVSIKL